MPIVERQEHERTITLGISACLVGQKVRYNGDHKRSSMVLNILDKFFHLRAVCPEVEIGMGVPREPIRLVGEPDQDYRVVGSDHPENDFTEQLLDFGHKTGEALDKDISGYILMQRSPSCGMERVKIYHKNGHPLGASGPGMYARALMETCPLLPVEEEGRLHDSVLRDNFFTRVIAWHRWQQEMRDNSTYAGLVAYHSAYKYILMAHSPQNYRKLGQMVSVGKKKPVEETASEYIQLFMDTLKQRANRKSHTNVMLHLLGYMKKTLSDESRHTMLELIEQYRIGQIPLVVPVTMLRHFLNIHGSQYVKDQVYLQPHPEELGLRNTI
ncbi:DUF523 and DUF1722 domain-containing protein [Sansalvadorimonas sp. 2012CJ34-2]|uniref:DUF523 and DUF1722 domain-containing protein n=1 Tax=Parendozoicomonas callyspongiae TaxID=2942213 RepID=A0ABT0PAN0_9GAMM|nr:DUF523 and DUF1722 domain-containing protein [Sansalvadorimonas sp. 2012CJ34-2]MCL6268409.1 DUF523 and DUF1722 domain-containing protein [Sansalvadorimonas sp. 2012CJ34-2]